MIRPKSNIKANRKLRWTYTRHKVYPKAILFYFYFPHVAAQIMNYTTINKTVLGRLFITHNINFASLSVLVSVIKPNLNLRKKPI